jgi:hypothetical protein
MTARWGYCLMMASPAGVRANAAKAAKIPATTWVTLLIAALALAATGAGGAICWAGVKAGSAVVILPSGPIVVT